VNKRLALVGVWAVFAAAAVGVGFGAAGLVDAPFAEELSSGSGTSVSAAGGGNSPVGTDAAPDGATLAPGSDEPTEDATTPSLPRSTAAALPPGGTATSTRGRPGTGRSTTRGTPSKSATRRPPSASAPRGTTSSSRTTSRSINTRGGYVQARCSNGLAAVSASPAVGWRLDEKSPGWLRQAEVRFQLASDDDQRVKVDVTCSTRGPVFAVRNETGGGGGGGGGDGGGSGRGGGSDD
jgi:hypothetical protein